MVHDVHVILVVTSQHSHPGWIGGVGFQCVLAFVVIHRLKQVAEGLVEYLTIVCGKNLTKACFGVCFGLLVCFFFEGEKGG